MYSIELKDEKNKFLKYISESPDNIIDNKNFFLSNDEGPKDYNIFPSFNEFYYNYNDNKIKIIFKEEGTPKSNSFGPITYFTRLTIYHDDLDILKNIINDAINYKEKKEDNKINLYTSKIRGYWEKYDSIYVQSFEDIYIDNKIKNSIISDLDNFLNSVEKYKKFGRCHKYNMLLYGIHGAGKTSLAKALAKKYNYSLYIISLSKKLDDENYIELISSIKDNAIILYEDIDTFFNNRSSVNNDISYSCITNMLDGTLTKSNSTISILTANDISFLDKPFLRHGRIDKIVKFDYPKKEQIQQAYKALINDDNFELFYNKTKSEKITMSGYVDFLFNNPTTYMEKISNLINSNKLITDNNDIYL